MVRRGEARWKEERRIKGRRKGGRKSREDHETGGRDGQQSARAIREYREAQK